MPAEVAVLGAGPGGLAVAFAAASRGGDVRLWSRSAPRVAAIAGGRIRAEGVLAGVTQLTLVSNDIGRVVRGAQLLLVATPASAHDEVLAALAPHLLAGQVLLLLPGQTGGALAARRRVPRGVILGEACTLPFIARSPAPDVVRITGQASAVPTAAVWAPDTPQLIECSHAFLPSLCPAVSVVETSLANVNAVMHPPALLLGAAWVEATGGRFRFYSEGSTGAVLDLMRAVDDERLGVGEALGVTLLPFPELFVRLGSTSAGPGASFAQALAQSEPNRELAAPERIDHRFFREDVGYGLMPMIALGAAAGAACPVMGAIATLVHTLLPGPFPGRDLAAMGLAPPLPGSLMRELGVAA